MSRTLHAIFDGQDLKLQDPQDLEPNRCYRVTVEEVSEPTPASAWSELETLAGTVDAPGDWSIEHDHYLYGTPRHEG
jgi:hypothetical protein